jgi:hypothetical protein
MRPRTAVVTLAVCTSLAPLGRTPAPGKGSEDPDDLNGDGHRDLVVPVFVGTGDDYAADERVGVVVGVPNSPGPEAG